MTAVQQEKIAVILFNLGGPDNMQAVKPFLFNLFKDKNIIPLPAIVRYPLGWLISTLRHKKAQKIYEKLGGKSPINPQTYAQAQALEAYLQNNNQQNYEYKTFMCMRYWHPMSDEVIQNVKDYAPDKIILLPLYPQMSTSTTQSSFEEWDLWAKRHDLNIPTTKICCYPENDGFCQAYADLICDHLKDYSPENPDIEILFSAHGIPQDFVDKFGDPYQSHVHESVDKIVGILSKKNIHFPHQICYQSKVGPKKWLLPNTEDIITQQSQKNKILCIVPIAFISEHSETLVELDMDYKDLAQEQGAKDYIRIPAVGLHQEFIAGLGDMVKKSLFIPESGQKKHCSKEFCACMRQKKENILRF
jgi:ferrochelatase